MPWLSIYLKSAPNIFAVLDHQTNVAEIFWAIMPLFHCAVLFLVPSIIMGIGFPLALQAWSNCQHLVGQTTGTVYGANTIGAVLGGVITGFILIPLMGTQLSIALLAIAALVLILRIRPGEQKRSRADKS